jgi:hypothetical protein
MEGPVSDNADRPDLDGDSPVRHAIGKDGSRDVPVLACRACGRWMDPSLTGRARQLRIDGMAAGTLEDPTVTNPDDPSLCYDCD